MNAIGRATLCLGLLSSGFAGQAGLDALCTIERPPLRRPLISLPMEIGGWSGRDEEIDKDILRISGASEYLNRSYTNPKFPGSGSRSGSTIRSWVITCITRRQVAFPRMATIWSSPNPAWKRSRPLGARR